MSNKKLRLNIRCVMENVAGFKIVQCSSLGDEMIRNQ
jgi:hypothetical protein